jgi:phytoene synthase
MPLDTQLETLPPPWRLALAYAPREASAVWLSFLALDVRLAGVVRAAREPMLGQMKLAWWRDRLNADPRYGPRASPCWRAEGLGRRSQGPVPLVDGWEACWANGTAARRWPR